MVDDKPVQNTAQKPGLRAESFETEEADEAVHTPLHNEVYAGKDNASAVTPAVEQPAQPENVAQQVQPAPPEKAAQQVQPAPPEKAAGQQDVAQAGDPPAEQKGDKTKVTDRAEAAPEKESGPIDPYESIDRAQTLARELELLLQQKRKPDEKISVQDNGQFKEVKVSDRVAQLKTEMAAEIERGKKGADAILMKGTATNPGIDDLAKQTNADRDRLCKELGLDAAAVTPKSLNEAFQKAVGDTPKQNKIKELAQVMADRDAISRLHFAPMTVRLVEAEFRARGYLDPSMKIGDEVPDAEIKKAFDVLKGINQPGGKNDLDAFGDGKEIREAKEVFETSDKTVNILYMAQQQKRAETIAQELNAAKNGEGDKEQHLKNAIKIADTLNVGWLANQTYREDNIKSKVSDELLDIVRMGSNARLKYSEHLVSQGRFHEAQGLMAQVKADSPELIFAKEGERIIYRKHEDGKTYEELDRAVNLGLTINPANFDVAQTVLFDKLGKDKIGTTDDANKFVQKLKDGTLANDADVLKYLNSDSSTSSEALKMMKIVREQTKKDMTAANQVLDKEVEALDAKKKTYDNRQLNQDEEVEKARIERQMASLKLTREEREQYSKRMDAMTDFTEGLIHLSQGGAKSAHGLFESSLAKDPSLNDQLTAMKVNNKDLQSVSDLAKMTDDTLDGYWKRNYKKFAVAGAAVAGTLTGVGLIGAAGYVGAGVTTTAVVATAGGAFAGGGVHWGIHRSVNENAGWPEFRDGAKIGGMSAALVASPWAAQAYRAKLGTDVAAASQIGNMASKIGVTKGLLAGSLAMSYSLEAGNVYFDKKPVGKAMVDGTKEGVFNSLMMGISRNWGMAGETAAVKQAMFNPYTIGTGLALGFGPEAVAMAADGKPLDKAMKDGGVNSLQYTFMFGLATKMHATMPGATTGLGRFGLNKWTMGAGLGLGAAPELKAWALDGKSGEQALKEGAYNTLLDTATFAALKKYGLSDHGTGASVAAPTMRDASRYAMRAFMMQESWNVAISVGSKRILHDVMGKPYYIKDQGSGFVAPLVADFLDRNYGSELDPKHLGDRKTVNSNLDALNPTLSGSLRADKKEPDPLYRPTVTGDPADPNAKKDDKRGLFFDYSRKPKK